MINQLIREIKIQIFLNHPNIIKLYSFFDDQYRIYLILQLAPDGQLYQYMKDGKKFSQESVSFLIRQILLGVDYMHEHHVIHRDLKPENIVIIHVSFSSLREYPRFVTSVGLFTVLRSSGQLSAARLSIFRLKFLKGIYITKKLTLGLWARSHTNSLLARTRLK